MDAEKAFPHGTTEFEQNADLAQVVPELRAQVEKLRALGLHPSHMDNHMGSLYGIGTGRFELLQAAVTLAGEYKLPFRLPKILSERHFGNRNPRLHTDEVLIARGRFHTGKVSNLA